MGQPAMAVPLTAEAMSDEEVVVRVLSGETALFEIVMRRYNQRLYRAARAITHDDSQAEDILQATYVRAYEHLRQYSGYAPFGAWLTRIAVNEALGRLRSLQRFDDLQGEGASMDHFAAPGPTPEQGGREFGDDEAPGVSCACAARQQPRCVHAARRGGHEHGRDRCCARDQRRECEG